MSERFEPLEEFMVSDLDTLKVLSDPFRLRILEQMGQKPTTVKRIAAQLGVSPKKLYYHVNLMEKHQLLVVVDTQLVSGIVEKWYQARACRFAVDKSLLALTEGPDGAYSHLQAMLRGILDATRDGVMGAARQGLIKADEKDRRRGTMYMQRGRMALTAEQYQRFVKRWEALLAEFDLKESVVEIPSQRYGYTFLVYPVPDSESDEVAQTEGRSHGRASTE
jgi:DNA-binding transcriptional ArsR family regulator